MSSTRYGVEDVLDILLADSDSDSDSDDDPALDNDDVQSDEAGSDAESVESIRFSAVSPVPGPTPRNVPAGGRGKRRRVQANQDDFQWELLEEDDIFQLDWCPDFVENISLKVDMADADPLEFFYKFYPKGLFRLFVEQTNLYADQFFQTEKGKNLSAGSRFSDWSKTNEAEMRAYTCLEIAMGLCIKPEMRQHWDTWWLTQTPNFTNVLRHNRFEVLRSFFHINDNTKRIQHGQPGYDILFKVRPLMDMVQPTYLQLYQPGRQISVDESMLRFKGRLSIRQYMPAKPSAKWGIKVWSLCDSKTGFLCRWYPYTGKAGDQVPREVGLGEHVVKTLVHGEFENKGHHLFIDNFFTSPGLVHSLQDVEIGTCGTVRANRKGLPPDIKTTKLRKVDAPKSEEKNMIACYWQDTGKVQMVSSISESSCQEKQIRSKDNPTGYRNVKKPTLAVEYNKFMGGVDKFDQFCAAYKFSHKCQKWYHVVYHFAREAALVNGWICYNIAYKDRKALQLSQIEFRRSVCNGLLQGYEAPELPRPGRRSTATEQRLFGRHFPAMHGKDCDCEKCSGGDQGASKSYPDCVVCSIRSRQCNATRKRDSQCRRKQTSHFCPDCPDKPALCPVPCFRSYHTKRDYKIKCTCA